MSGSPKSSYAIKVFGLQRHRCCTCADGSCMNVAIADQLHNAVVESRRLPPRAGFTRRAINPLMSVNALANASLVTGFCRYAIPIAAALPLGLN